MLFLLEVFVFLCIFGYFVGRNRWVEQPASCFVTTKTAVRVKFWGERYSLCLFALSNAKNLEEKESNDVTNSIRPLYKNVFSSSQLICWLIIMRSYQAKLFRVMNCDWSCHYLRNICLTADIVWFLNFGKLTQSEQKSFCLVRTRLWVLKGNTWFRSTSSQGSKNDS